MFESFLFRQKFVDLPINKSKKSIYAILVHWPLQYMGPWLVTSIVPKINKLECVDDDKTIKALSYSVKFWSCCIAKYCFILLCYVWYFQNPETVDVVVMWLHIMTMWSFCFKTGFVLNEDMWRLNWKKKFNTVKQPGFEFRLPEN